MNSRDKDLILRHFLAALAYRTQKALRGAPDDFAGFNAGNMIRTPMELVRHMTSVLGENQPMPRMTDAEWPERLAGPASPESTP